MKQELLRKVAAHFPDAGGIHQESKLSDKKT